jgi:hypothetical protein
LLEPGNNDPPALTDSRQVPAGWEKELALRFGADVYGHGFIAFERVKAVKWAFVERGLSVPR